LDLINIRRVAWGQEERKSPSVDDALVEALAAKILEHLK